METGVGDGARDGGGPCEAARGAALYSPGSQRRFRPEMVVWSVVLAVPNGPVRRAIPRALVASAPSSRAPARARSPFGPGCPLAVLAKPSDLAHGLAVRRGCRARVVWVSWSRSRRSRSCAGGTAPLRSSLAGVAHFAAIAAAGGDWMPYARLAAPVAPSLLYAFVLASPRMSRISATLRVLVAGAIAAYVLVRAAPAGRHVESRVEALVRAAVPELAGARRIAALDIGWPTAASDAAIIDLAGLTDPEIAALPGRSHVQARRSRDAPRPGSRRNPALLAHGRRRASSTGVWSRRALLPRI